MGRHLLRLRVSSVSCIVVLVLVLFVVVVGANPRRLSQSQTQSQSQPQLEVDDPRRQKVQHEETAGSQDSEELRKMVLKGLGLSREPDVSKMNVSQEEYSRMYNVYLRAVEENARRHDENTPASRVQRFYSFTHTQNTGAEEVSRAQRVRRDASSVRSSWLYFPIDIPERRKQQVVSIEHATLRLFVSADATREEPSVHVRVYQVLADYPGEEERILVDSKILRLQALSSKWTDFDVTKAVKAWNTDSNTDTPNLGLELECRECERKGITLVTRDTSGGNSSVGPVLNLVAGVHLDSREKRSAGYDLLNVQDKQKEVCHKDGQKCCRHVMKVNFKDTPGLEYIIQPKEFDAGYCKGRCPPLYNLAHHHAVLQTLVRKKKSQSGEKIPRVCCAPSRLRELEVLHIDEEDSSKLKMTLWDNMQVLECACS